MADVPQALGVPALLTGLNNSIDAGVAFLTNDLLSVSGLLSSDTQWGIYLNGALVVAADTVISVEYKRESAISDYPLEGGVFESFDKVALPRSARVRFAAGGSENNRSSFLASLHAIEGDYNLYDVVTPEDILVGYNVQHVDYSRSANNGLGLVIADVWLEEIRISGTAGQGFGTQTAQPDGTDQVKNGAVQATDTTNAQSSEAQATLGNPSFAAAGGYSTFSGAIPSF